MKIEMNMLESSEDYFLKSLDFYNVADEFGEHRECFSDIQNKKNWKWVFISIAGAFELLFKHKLYLINPILICKDVDRVNLKVFEDKTIEAQLAFYRLQNFDKVKINKRDERVFLSCIHMRNSYIHNIVSLQTEEAKKLYIHSFLLYIKLYNALLNKNIEQKYKRIGTKRLEFDYFLKAVTYYKGEEVSVKDLEELMVEYDKYSKCKYFIDENNKRIERIKYGNECNFVSDPSTTECCPDCGVLLGEYHLDLCDIEICPICKKQKLSCECKLEYDV